MHKNLEAEIRKFKTRKLPVIKKAPKAKKLCGKLYKNAQIINNLLQYNYAKKKITIEYLADDARYLIRLLPRTILPSLSRIVATKDDLKTVNERLDRLEKVLNLTDTIDKFAKIITDYHQEQLLWEKS